MGGVDRTDQLSRMYGFDWKSKRYWLHIFFQFFDYAINKAYLLYKNSCHGHKFSAKDLLSFWLELVHLLSEQVGLKEMLLDLVKKPEMLPRVKECVS